MNFILDPILEKDSIFITNLKLCELRLISNINFPWIILIPRIPNISEITDLDEQTFLKLNTEIFSVSKIMKTIFQADKLNIATIGNVVKQMHVHIVVRYKNDILYPKTVWGDKMIKYKKNDASDIINRILSELNKITEQ